MVVGEAPGRLGADSSELPFHGDRAGHNFESLIDQVGLNRSSLYITNAALCNPKDENGNNATPTAQEVANCSAHLKRQIDLIQPDFVVTLGAVALKAIEHIERHGLSLASSVRTSHNWNGRTLVPLYHPGQRAMIHRSFANQLADYQFLAELFSRRGKKRSVGTRKSTTQVARVAHFLLLKFGRIKYFRLHKLLYLTEFQFKQDYGHRMTSAYFVRQKDGPYCPELHPQRLANSGLPVEYWHNKEEIGLRGLSGTLFQSEDGLPDIDPEICSTVEKIYAKYSQVSDAQLKTASYLTRPMRSLLKREKAGSNQFNAPIVI